MPRKTKEIMDEKENKKAETKQNSTKKTEKSPTKPISTKKSSAKNNSSSMKKNNTAKVSKRTTSSQKKKEDKPITQKTTSSRAKSTKKVTDSKTKSTKKSSTSKEKSTRKSRSVTKKPDIPFVEYYDLPYRYNQTVVKVLAQTPKNLFIYWDISDEDRKLFKKQYGENFFETTYPVLIVYNDTLNYHFEVAINDFANSWYLHVNDSKSKYRIELGRKPKNYQQFNHDIKTINQSIQNDINYIQISSSNNIDAPNDRILFNPKQKMVYYKNIKTKDSTFKPITSLSFLQNMGKFYDIQDIHELYQKLYQEENIENLYNLSNPSSGNPSSNSSFSNYPY